MLLNSENQFFCNIAKFSRQSLFVIFRVKSQKIRFFETLLDYLLAKSSKDEQEWYTHKRVKSYAFQLLKVYSSGNLFRCVYENNLKLANTNNFLEGGINSPIRRLLSHHRGMKYEHQMQLIELYLFKRSKLYNLVKLGEHSET